MQVLEARGFDVVLVNPAHTKHVPGRKTAMEDCQRLQQLHSYGLLSASFRPAFEIIVVRAYWRQRDQLVRQATTAIQHIQKALDQMNLHSIRTGIGTASAPRRGRWITSSTIRTRPRPTTGQSWRLPLRMCCTRGNVTPHDRELIAEGRHRFPAHTEAFCTASNGSGSPRDDPRQLRDR